MAFPAATAQEIWDLGAELTVLRVLLFGLASLFLLGVLVFLWTLVMGVTGWYKHPTLLNLFWVVVLIEVAVLLWVLRQTAPTTEYIGQVRECQRL